MKINEYIDLATSKITGRRDRFFVEMELKSHIDDRIAYYTDAGYDLDIAEQKALEKMGDPATVCDSISKLHNAERYKKLATVLNVVYLLSMAFGASWIVWLFYSLDLYERNVAMLTCVFSIICFAIMTFAHRFSHMSQSVRVLSLNGWLSVVNFVAVPIMYLPTFSSILSLPFEFPVESKNETHGFEFFYYPLDTSIFEKWESTQTLAGISQWILWGLMFLSCFVPLINAISSLATAKRYANNAYDGNDERRYDRVAKISRAMVIITVISALCLTTEIVLVAGYEYSKEANRQASYYYDSNEAWALFDSVQIPCSTAELCDAIGDLQYEVDWDEYEQFGDLELISNENYNVDVHYIDWMDDSDKCDINKKTISNNNCIISDKRLEMINTTSFETLDEFLQIVERDEITSYSVDSDETVDVQLAENAEKSLFLVFEKGVLTSKELFEYE